jgi:hypothetical protein
VVHLALPVLRVYIEYKLSLPWHVHGRGQLIVSFHLYLITYQTIKIEYDHNPINLSPNLLQSITEIFLSITRFG